MQEKGFVLYDPEKERYLGDDGIPHTFPSKARVFRSMAAAERQQEWW